MPLQFSLCTVKVCFQTTNSGFGNGSSTFKHCTMAMVHCVTLPLRVHYRGITLSPRLFFRCDDSWHCGYICPFGLICELTQLARNRSLQIWQWVFKEQAASPETQKAEQYRLHSLLKSYCTDSRNSASSISLPLQWMECTQMSHTFRVSNMEPENAHRILFFFFFSRVGPLSASKCGTSRELSHFKVIL